MRLFCDNITMIYKAEKTLSYSELDFKGFWKPENIFLTMQEAAGIHATRLGAGYEALKQIGITWVLVKSALKMEKYPGAGTKVCITTWPAPERRMFFPRFFIFQDEAGNLLGTASTLWALMDISTRTIVAPAAKGVTLPTPAEGPMKLELPGKIRVPEGEIKTDTVVPKYSDLDINCHVNNSKYIDWFTDHIPLDVHKNGHLTEIAISYSKEIVSGENVCLEFSRNDNQFRLAGKNGDQTYFVVNANWTEETK